MSRKEESNNVALMVYRNIPSRSGNSSAELLFRTKTYLPRGSDNKTLEKFKQKDKDLKEYQRGYTDKIQWAKRRSSLTRGDQV